MPDLARWSPLPQSLLGRLSLVMVVCMLLAQLAGHAIWARQLRAESEAETRTASGQLAHSASGALRYFLSLPPNYRPLVIQQFREMGGTRFFVNLNSAPVALRGIEENTLAAIAIEQVGRTLKADVAHAGSVHIGFAWPDTLEVSDDGIKVGSLPDN